MPHDPQPPTGPVAARLQQKLLAAFDPAEVIVQDDSAKHAGHAGAPAGGESHFSVVVISPQFDGLSRVDRQRRINKVLADELAGPVHALAVMARTPAEVGS